MTSLLSNITGEIGASPLDSFTNLAATTAITTAPTVMYILTLLYISSLDGSTVKNTPDLMKFKVDNSNGMKYQSPQYSLAAYSKIALNEKFLCRDTSVKIEFIKGSNSIQTSSFDCKAEMKGELKVVSGIAFKLKYNLWYQVEKITTGKLQRSINLKNILAMTQPQDQPYGWDDEILVYVKTDVIGIQQLKLKYNSQYVFNRNGLLIFKNLTIPCNKNASIFLREYDDFSSDDYTDVAQINCESYGIGQVDLTFQASENEKQSTYSVQYEIKDSYPSYASSEYELATIFEPNQIKQNYIPQSNRYITSTKVVKIGTLVNFNGQNDQSKNDELYLYIYSDTLKQMFSCGQYNSPQGSVVDFKNLEIPCNEYIVLILAEKDTVFDDSYGIRMSCQAIGEQIFDFPILGGDVKVGTQLLVNGIEAIGKVVKDPIVGTIIVATKFACKLLSTFKEETDALYSLRVQVQEKNTTYYQNTNLESYKSCQAEVFSPKTQFNWISNIFPSFYNYPSTTKVAVLKYLASSFGKQDKIGLDSIFLSIYSDYYGKIFTCGEFKMDSNRYIVFNDLEVPCVEEIVVTLLEYDEKYSDSNSLRIKCSTIGRQSLKFQLKAYQANYDEAVIGPDITSVNGISDFAISIAAQVLSQTENQAQYELQLEVRTNGSGNASRLNDQYCGVQPVIQNIKKPLKSLVNLKTLKYSVGKDEKPYIGATVFSDVTGFTTIVFSSFNAITLGTTVTMNYFDDYVVECSDTIIVQLSSFDSLDVRTIFIDCSQQTEQPQIEKFILGAQRVPFDLKYKINVKAIAQQAISNAIQQNAYQQSKQSKVVGFINKTIAPSFQSFSVVELSSRAWDKGIEKLVEKSTNKIFDYLEKEAYAVKNSLSSTEASQPKYLRQYELKYTINKIQTTLSPGVKTNATNTQKPVLDTSGNITQQLINKAYYDENQFVLVEDTEENERKKIIIYVAVAVGSAIATGLLAVLGLYLLRKYRWQPKAKVEVFKAYDTVNVFNFQQSDRSEQSQPGFTTNVYHSDNKNATIQELSPNDVTSSNLPINSADNSTSINCNKLQDITRQDLV
eukprot:403373863